MKKQENSKIVIAVDGHSSCGKSTVARELAQELGFIYIDSGAMYRAVTLYALRNGFVGEAQTDERGLVNCLDRIRIRFVHNPVTRHNDTWLNDENVEDEIRSLPVSEHVSTVAAIAGVRRALVVQQREMGAYEGIVMDGRDIGTVVFPHADLKIFMTASPAVRAQRRYDELTAKGIKVSYEEILQNISHRDTEDSQRAVAPLKKADDAIIVDNSTLTREEQLRLILEQVNKTIADKQKRLKNKTS